MPNVKIEEGAIVEKAIIDSDKCIPKGEKIGDRNGPEILLISGKEYDTDTLTEILEEALNSGVPTTSVAATELCIGGNKDE